MAPSHLQGLNIVQPSPPPTPYLSDADLLSLPIPDLNAQLELWTNLNFQSDEPLVPVERAKAADSKSKHHTDDYDRYTEQDDEAHARGGIAETAAHENVVNPTVLPPTGAVRNPSANPPPGAVGVPAGMPMPLDISGFLASLGIDPFLAPAVQQSPAAAPNASSIAQLLAMQATAFLPAQLSPQVAAPPAQPAQPTLVQPTPVQPASQKQSLLQQQHAQAPAPVPKRARTARNSVSSPDTPVPESPEADDKHSGTPVHASEDKRRRNTAASARFRLKKKEREAALERKAKELEVRVSELEKECEALRRENGWLKGLVVGVTGGAVQQTTTGTKRTREESEQEPVAASA
ncbi:hypothetical protein FOMPIDRAFT_1045923 [Fomitopsis schrenkii]|uniref:BZIP domain-containing protein n=1 Tax=Fomitopsis schrenkii TaxID=2126942 RepID=S8FU07_FOMSC|nr:hypothetical protein FOMPIDRAFT_1045923 [Fomitopsis schrenkii]